jgi:hypothetical protein
VTRVVRGNQEADYRVDNEKRACGHLDRFADFNFSDLSRCSTLELVPQNTPVFASAMAPDRGLST